VLADLLPQQRIAVIVRLVLIVSVTFGAYSGVGIAEGEGGVFELEVDFGNLGKELGGLLILFVLEGSGSIGLEFGNLFFELGARSLGGVAASGDKDKEKEE
jgi:hypothetical protein